MHLKMAIIRIHLVTVLSTIVPIAAASRLEAGPAGFTAYGSEEERLVSELGLSGDACDEEIISLLDDPKKRFYAMSLIARRKISSATPKLLEMLAKKGERVTEKVSMAETLFALGNTDWIEPMKRRLLDPNRGQIRTDVACLLTQAGDYSAFQTILDPTSRSETRSRAATSLAGCCVKGCADPNAVVRILAPLAKNDPEADVRGAVLEPLAEIAAAGQTSPQAMEIAVDALCAAARGDSDAAVRLEAAKSLNIVADRIKAVPQFAEPVAAMLSSMGKSASEVKAREEAIVSLDKIAFARREITPILMETLKANLNHNDETFRRWCAYLQRIWQDRQLTNEEVLALLDERGLKSTVVTQIRERRLKAAIPKLRTIVKGGGSAADRLQAAKSLAGLADMSWTTDMKRLAADPNSGAELKHRITIASMLARTGDYSLFELVAANAAHKDAGIRYSVASVLPHFVTADDQTAAAAAESIVSIAMSAPSLGRHQVLRYLEEMGEARPELFPVIVREFEAYPENDVSKQELPIYRYKLQKWNEGKPWIPSFRFGGGAGF